MASDLYDGCIIYDFEGSRTFLCDLDEYRDGSFVLDMDRAYGSRRFMAPEEFRRGATSSERARRYQSVSEVVEQWRAAAGGSPVVQP